MRTLSSVYPFISHLGLLTMGASSIASFTVINLVSLSLRRSFVRGDGEFLREAAAPVDREADREVLGFGVSEKGFEEEEEEEDEKMEDEEEDDVSA